MTTIRVNPGDSIETACHELTDGDTLEIAGNHQDQHIAVKANGVTVQGVLDAIGNRPQLLSVVPDGKKLPPDFKLWGAAWSGRGICVIKGRDATVRDLEIAGAKSNNFNGAGIRHEGENLTVDNCYLHDNQNGILGSEHDDPATAEREGGTVWVQHSEFDHNGAGDGQSHNIYIARAKLFGFVYNKSHSARVGHLCKGRAQTSVIVDNSFSDGDGNPSYHCDIDGGTAIIAENNFERLAKIVNPVTSRMIYYYLWHDNAPNRLIVVNNRMTSLREQMGHFVVADSRVQMGGGKRTGAIGQMTGIIRDNVAICSARKNLKGLPYPDTWLTHPWLAIESGALVTVGDNVVVPIGQEPAQIKPFVLLQDNVQDYIAKMAA